MHGRILVLAVTGLICATAAAPADDDDWQVSDKVLSCSPRVLKHGGSVALVLGPQHGAELAIRRSSEKSYYVLVVASAPHEMKPLMTPDAFKAARRVTLTEATEGLLWEDNTKSERVFSKSGRYIVYVSDKLESEAGGYRCTIDYSH